MATSHEHGNKNHALVFGASGLIGWSAVNQLLSNYPEEEAFERVTAITNRPVELSESFWPTGPGRPELKLVSGIDLTKGDGRGVELADDLGKEAVVGVTHVFYFGETSHSMVIVSAQSANSWPGGIVFTSLIDHIEEVATNKRMMQNVLGALEISKAPLKFFVFPGGTRVIYSVPIIFSRLAYD